MQFIKSQKQKYLRKINGPTRENGIRMKSTSDLYSPTDPSADTIRKRRLTFCQVHQQKGQ